MKSFPLGTPVYENFVKRWYPPTGKVIFSIGNTVKVKYTDNFGHFTGIKEYDKFSASMFLVRCD